MDEREKEILKGMVNCYNVCRKDFYETVHMVAGARGLSDNVVIEILNKAKAEHSDEYVRLRSKLPESFPM
ncbi:MAG: hypothetical protein QXG73_02440 [Candidatus Micrarchaeaceae archaeon]